MHTIYLAIDNGHTGTVAWVGEGLHPTILETPVKKEQSYTKKAQKMTRVDHVRMAEIFQEVRGDHDPSDVLVILERPMTNNKFGKAVISAARAFDVTRCLVEQAHFAYEIVDSKQWQRVMLPTGIKGSDNLKAASMDIGLRLFPDQEKVIKHHKDADALLMAEWARRAQL